MHLLVVVVQAHHVHQAAHHRLQERLEDLIDCVDADALHDTCINENYWNRRDMVRFLSLSVAMFLPPFLREKKAA